MQLLACRVDLSVDCDRLAECVAPMLQQAVQRHPVLRVHRLQALRDDGGYRIREDGLERGRETAPGSTAYALAARMHALALAAMPAYTKVHAGSASWRGRRLLMVGPPRAGKTTLMTRLVFEGFSVHGDELALLRDGQSLPYPRRFGVRGPTVPLIPELAARGASASRPLVTDPAALGFDWVIEPAPVTHVFYLQPNHGGGSVATPCPRYLMVQRIMSQSTAPAGGKRQWIHDVCDTLHCASSYTLALGSLDEAVAAIREILQRTPSVAMRATEVRDG